MTPEENCCPDLRELLSPPFFRALSDPTRSQILTTLAGAPAPATVSEVAAECPVDISVVSRHLATLRGAGIVEAKKRGREVRYGIRTAQVARFLRSLADAIERCCPETAMPRERSSEMCKESWHERSPRGA